LLDIISKNVSQIEADRNIILNTTTTPFIYYTCPAGKRARISGWVRCVDRGGSNEASFEAAGVVLYTWNDSTSHVGLGSAGYLLLPERMTTFGGGEVAKLNVILEATETIRAIQNLGFTNAQFKIYAQVKELPA